MTKDFLELLEQSWELILLVTGGISGLVAKYVKNRNQSTQKLYETIEELKLQIIANIEKDIDLASELAEKEKLLNEMRINCPDCYDRYVKKHKKNNDDE